MDENKPRTDASRAGAPAKQASPGGLGSTYLWGIMAGVAIAAVVFHRPLIGMAHDAFTNIMPIFFTPGLLDLTLGLLGFGFVILINYWLLRKEARDEWVVLPEDEDSH